MVLVRIAKYRMVGQFDSFLVLLRVEASHKLALVLLLNLFTLCSFAKTRVQSFSSLMLLVMAKRERLRTCVLDAAFAFGDR